MFSRFRARLAVAGCALFALAAIASAQTKVAVVSMQKAVLDTAEIKKASAELEAKYKPRQAEMEKAQKELQDIQQTLQTNSGKLTPQAEAELNARGQLKQRQLQRMSEDLQEDVNRERNQILGQSSQKMRDVVQKLAEAKAIDVVVDVSNTIYYKPALDLTDEAIAAYDKAYPPK